MQGFQLMRRDGDFCGNQIVIADSDGNTVPLVGVDGEYALTTASFVVRKIHQGEMFGASYLWDSIADGDDAEILIATGNKECHLMFQTQCEGNSVIALYEDVTTDDDGTEVASYDLNRVTGNSPASTIYRDPSITDDGLTLPRFLAPGGKRVKATGGVSANRNEIVLKPNSKYAIRVTNESGAAAIVSVLIEWIEKG